MKKNEKIILFISILCLLFDLIFVVFYNLIPVIELNDGDLILELEENYQEPGFSAHRIFFDYTQKVTVENTIDHHKIGTYNVVYTIDWRGKIYQKIRHVTVKDSIKPILTLLGNETVTLCPGTEYQEEGFESFDNYDGNLKDKVKKEIQDHWILYSVEDSSFNKTEQKRFLNYEDQESPVITLKGGNAYSMYVGEQYIESGFSAMDNCDGDLTNQVEVRNSIQNKAGTYTVTYTVKDKTGNVGTATRTVIVLEKKQSNGKIIYLTFDDGPSASITPYLLDILKEEKVPATFFVLNRDSSLDYLIKREYIEGHTVALHGSSHNYKQIYSSSKAFFDDLSIIQNKVKNITGSNPTIIRFPGGSSNTVSKFNPGIMSTLAKEVTEKGFQYFDWNVGSGDSGEARNADQVYQNVVNHLNKNHNVVLMHDMAGNEKTLKAIRKIIQYGKNNGYRFEKITMNTPTVHHNIAN